MTRAGIRSRLQRWLFRVGGPEPAPIRLGQRRIFVLPTGFGLALGLTLLVMLLASINYALSLGFGLTFLIGSVAWISIHHAQRIQIRSRIHTLRTPGRLLRAHVARRTDGLVDRRHRADLRRLRRSLQRLGDAEVDDLPLSLGAISAHENV